MNPLLELMALGTGHTSDWQWLDLAPSFVDVIPVTQELFFIDGAGTFIGEMRSNITYQIVTPGSAIADYHAKWVVTSGDTPTSPSAGWTENTWIALTEDRNVEDDVSAVETRSGVLTISLSRDGGTTTLATATVTWSNQGTA